MAAVLADSRQTRYQFYTDQQEVWQELLQFDHCHDISSVSNVHGGSKPQGVATLSSPRFVCPLSKTDLTLMPIEQAEQVVGGSLVPVRRSGMANSAVVGTTDSVLLRADHAGAYPVIDGQTPALMAPELLVPNRSSLCFDLTRSEYVEAYAEMLHYNNADFDRSQQLDELTRPGSVLAEIRTLPASRRAESFTQDWSVWIDAKYDGLAQWDCYQHIGDPTGRSVVQLGGGGMHAVKMLLAGADSAVLVTPMIGELRFATALADAMGVAAAFTAALGLGEQLPIPDASVDAVYSGGCIHHMETVQAMPEIARVLRVGGTFAAAEPWRSPFYGFGVATLGQRERNVYCRPLTRDRIEPLFDAFQVAEVIHHGALTRYPLLALDKFGVRLPLERLFRIFKHDDSISDKFPGVRRHGSSVALLGRKTQSHADRDELLVRTSAGTGQAGQLLIDQG